MSTQVKFRRGTRTEHNTFTGAEGEITVDITNDRAVVHDGVKAGGHPLANFFDMILNKFKTGAGTLSTGVYTITLDTAPAAYATYFEVIMMPGSNNAGAVDVNVNGLGARDIKKNDGAGTIIELDANDIVANIPAFLTYDGTRFLLQNAGSFNKLVIGGATGSTVTGDVNISGDFKKNGVVFGGSVALLATRTASASATLDFTSILTSGYDEYVFLFKDIRPSANGDFLMRTSINNSTFDTTGYAWATTGEVDFTAGAAGAANSYSSSASSLRITSGSGVDSVLAPSSITGHTRLYTPNSTTRNKFIKSAVQHGLPSSGNQVGVDSQGIRSTTSVVNAVRFLMSTGNIASGSILCYGIKNT